MKAKYIGDPRNPGEAKNVPEEFTAFGVTFPKGKFVDVPDNLAAKFEGNSHFETRGKADPEAADEPVVPAGGEPAPVVVDPELTAEAEEPAPRGRR